MTYIGQRHHVSFPTLSVPQPPLPPPLWPNPSKTASPSSSSNPDSPSPSDSHSHSPLLLLSSFSQPPYQRPCSLARQAHSPNGPFSASLRPGTCLRRRSPLTSPTAVADDGVSAGDQVRAQRSWKSRRTRSSGGPRGVRPRRGSGYARAVGRWRDPGRRRLRHGGRGRRRRRLRRTCARSYVWWAVDRSCPRTAGS